MGLHRAFLTFSGAIFLAFPSQANDLTFTGKAGTKVTFYGQINLTFQSVDDGQETYDTFVDNSNSVSRVGLWVDGTLLGNRARFNFETALGIESTAETSQTTDPKWLDWQRTDIRKFEVVYSGDFGRIWAGQGSMATDGVSEIDLSGTDVVGYSNLSGAAGAFVFRDGTALSGVDVGDVFKNLDGSRRFRLRYDSPEFSGFVLSLAGGEDVLSETDDATYYDAALRYGYKNDTVNLSAGVGYSVMDDEGSTVEEAIASVSATHLPTGLNLTIATGEQASDKGQYLYAKVGWSGEVTRLGKTSVAADLYDGSDFNVIGSSSRSWGVQIVQEITERGLEAYLGYREFAYDDVAGTNYEDVSAVLLGARWSF